jgi:hypothetical protein
MLLVFLKSRSVDGDGPSIAAGIFTIGAKAAEFLEVLRFDGSDPVGHAIRILSGSGRSHGGRWS